MWMYKRETSTTLEKTSMSHGEDRNSK